MEGPAHRGCGGYWPHPWPPPSPQMPVCSYFLKGICSNSNCPYSHVYVSRKAEVCADFLKGYCPLGAKVRGWGRCAGSQGPAGGRLCFASSHLSSSPVSVRAAVVGNSPQLSELAPSFLLTCLLQSGLSRDRASGRLHGQTQLWAGGPQMGFFSPWCPKKEPAHQPRGLQQGLLPPCPQPL